MNDRVEVSCIAVYHAVDVAIPFDIKQNVPSNNPYDGVLVNNLLTIDTSGS